MRQIYKRLMAWNSRTDLTEKDRLGFEQIVVDLLNARADINPMAIYSIDDLAAILDVEKSSVEQACADEVLTATAAGDTVFVTGQSILDWIGRKTPGRRYA